MNGITRTKHFDHRFQQRGMNNLVVMALLYYGERRASRHGIDSLIFTKTALVEIRNDYGTAIFKMCEKLRNTYIIMAEDGVLITVARSHRKTMH
jgi:hypothetical protein